jgi:hypothetical protein
MLSEYRGYSQAVSGFQGANIGKGNTKYSEQTEHLETTAQLINKSFSMVIPKPSSSYAFSPFNKFDPRKPFQCFR